MTKYENKIVIVTGGFDPLHSGHINLFKSAAKLGSRLIVGINSNKWLLRKKGYIFQAFSERKLIISNLNMVNEVISWDDKDDTAIGAIEIILKKYQEKYKIVFANGGDRINNNTPELINYVNNKRIEFKFGVGGKIKINSSSDMISKIIKNYNKKIT